VIAIVVMFVERLLLVALFLPFSALDKILNFDAAVGQASQAVSSRGFAKALIVVGFCVEVLMSAAILTGIADRIAAFFLAGYCIVTALLWKQFWKTSDFRLRGKSNGREVFWDFMKNLALAGGFLILAFGTSPASLHHFLAAPLSSSHPYGPPS
jgi:putative oxidoreductase